MVRALSHALCSFVDETSTSFRKTGTFTKNQTLALQDEFKLDYYPSKSRIKQLAKQTKLSERQVNDWHIRRRVMLKQEKCEFSTPTCVCTIYVLY